MSHPDYENVGDPEDKLIEEIGEVLQALGKCKRFGWFGTRPDCGGFTTVTNIDELRYELQDMVKAADNMEKKLRIIQRIHDGGKK